MSGDERVQQAVAGWYPDPTGTVGERWWNGKVWTKQTRPYAAPQSTAASYSWSTQPAAPEAPQASQALGWIHGGHHGRVANLGLLVAGAFLVGVASFLNWYAFTTPDGIPVAGGGGFDAGGGGVWALVLAAIAAVDALALWSARPDWMTLATRALWIDIVILGFNTGYAFYLVGNGQWHTVVTNSALIASPGPGLILLAIGVGVMLIATARISLLMRRGQWITAA